MVSSTGFALLTVACAVASGLSLHGYDSSINSKETFAHIVGVIDGGAFHRSTREADKKNPHKCCGNDPVVMPERERETMMSCKEQMGAQGWDSEQDKNMKGFSCWMECVGRNNSAVDNEGYVVLEELKKYYGQYYTDASLHDLTEKAMAECVPAANSKAKELGPEEINGRTCNRAIGLALMCIRYKIELGCPEADKIDDEGCSKLRNYLQEWNKMTDMKIA